MAAVAAFSKISAEHYGCSNARNRGICRNRLTIRRDVLEESVLGGLKAKLMHPDLVKEFVAEYHREINRVAAARDSDRQAFAKELATVEREIREIIGAIKSGMRSATMACGRRHLALAAHPKCAGPDINRKYGTSRRVRGRSDTSYAGIGRRAARSSCARARDRCP